MSNNCILQSMMVWTGLQHYEHQWRKCLMVGWLDTLIFYSQSMFLNDFYFPQSFVDSLNQIRFVCEPPYDQWDLKKWNSFSRLHRPILIMLFVLYDKKYLIMNGELTQIYEDIWENWDEHCGLLDNISAENINGTAGYHN